MGNTYVIYIYTRQYIEEEFKYEEFYRGESLFGMLLHMILAKKKGIMCIKLKWRP